MSEQQTNITLVNPDNTSQVQQISFASATTDNKTDYPESPPSDDDNDNDDNDDDDNDDMNDETEHPTSSYHPLMKYDQHPLHPIYKRNNPYDLQQVTQNCKLFLRRISQTNCFDRRNRRAVQCTCQSVFSSPSVQDATTQLMINFATQTKSIRQTLLKEWLRTAKSLQNTRQKGQKKRPSYNLPGVVVMDNDPKNNNNNKNKNKTVYLCKHGMMTVFSIGIDRWRNIERHMHVIGPMPPHGMKQKRNAKIRCEEALHDYFKDLAAEAVAMPTALKKNNDHHHDDSTNDKTTLKWLPDHKLSKRNLFEQFCHRRGWDVKPNKKGNYPPLQKFIKRTDQQWLANTNTTNTTTTTSEEGSSSLSQSSQSLPVCSWSSFWAFWKTHYPHLKIQKGDNNKRTEKTRNQFQTQTTREQ